MIQWCSYCHRFMREVPKFDCYQATFGVCLDCKNAIKSGKNNKALLSRIQAHHELYSFIKKAADSMSLLLGAAVIEKGLSLRLSPLDILLGIIQPALYEMGQLWESGQLSISQEHRFTAFCEQIISLAHLYADFSSSIYRIVHPSVLLVNAPGNIHTLGLRILEIGLFSSGISCITIYPGISISEILNLLKTLHPKVLGISIAGPQQLELLLNRIDQLPKETRPLSVCIGGYAVKMGLLTKIKKDNVKYTSDINIFITEITKTVKSIERLSRAS